MEIQEFLTIINIDKEIVFDNGISTVFLDNSNEYAKVYTSLTDSEYVELEPESVVISPEITSLKYKNNDFVVTLSADLSRDIYKLTFDEVL